MQRRRSVECDIRRTVAEQVFLAVRNNHDLSGLNGKIRLAGDLYPSHAFSDEMIDDQPLGARR
jgi:hypothetical protein